MGYGRFLGAGYTPYDLSWDKLQRLIRYVLDDYAAEAPVQFDAIIAL
jgi:hypothetical protein